MTIDTTAEPTAAEARTLFTQTVKKTAAAPDAGEPTVVVADVKATALAGLAWSEDDGDDETIQFDADRTTTFWLWLNVATTAALVLVLGVVLWFVLSEHRQPARDDASPASSAPDVMVPSSPPAAAPAPMPSVTSTPIAPPVAAPPPDPTWAAAPAQSNVTAQQASTICGWLRDPAWTMPQIESSTGDMLADDNPSFKGTPDVFKAIAAAMSSSCPEVANQRPF